MATSSRKSVLPILCLLISFSGFGQSGFYLTYPCKEGNADILKFDRTRRGLCVTSQPIVTFSDLHSISQPVEIGNDVFFDVQLTEQGFKKLEQVYPITSVIVFMVRDQVVFLMDTDKHHLAGTIRVHIVGRKDVEELRAILSQEIARSKDG